MASKTSELAFVVAEEAGEFGVVDFLAEGPGDAFGIGDDGGLGGEVRGVEFGDGDVDGAGFDGHVAEKAPISRGEFADEAHLTGPGAGKVDDEGVEVFVEGLGSPRRGGRGR